MFAGRKFQRFCSSSKNKFVHLALQKTLAVAVESKGLSAVQQGLSKANGLDIAIVGDNDFYSQGSQVRLIPLLTQD